MWRELWVDWKDMWREASSPEERFLLLLCVPLWVPCYIIAALIVDIGL